MAMFTKDALCLVMLFLVHSPFSVITKKEGKYMWKDSIFTDGSSTFVAPVNPQVGDMVSISLRVMQQNPLEEIFLRYKQDGLENLVKMECNKEKDGFCYYQCQIQIMRKKVSYHFYCITKEHTIYYYNQMGLHDYLQDETYDFRILAAYEKANWLPGMVFYQIFPDRFCNGNPEISVKTDSYFFDGHATKQIEDWNTVPEEYDKAFCLDFYGGDLYGVTQKLSYLEELGINGIYMTPIFSAATVHKYDCMDYFHVDSHLGGDSALEQLCEKMHEKQMRLVLDISINHTGMEHPWFSEIAKSGKGKKEFYYLGEDGYGCYANVHTLPKLNYQSDSLRAILYEDQDSVLRKWLRPPYSIDGWRFDVAATTGEYKKDHFSHDLWKKIRKALKEENAEAYILAEDWNDAAEFLQGDQWDGIMNFFGCGRPIREYVGQLDFRHSRKPELRQVLPNQSAHALQMRIMQFFGKLPYVVQESQFNMLDCHDVSRLHNDPYIDFASYQIAVSLMYMLPGCVCMYYGDEIGLKGRLGSTEGCRYPMEWHPNSKEHPHFRLYQTWNRAKQQYTSLRTGSFRIIKAVGRVFACMRFQEQEAIICVTSMEECNQSVILPLEAYLGKGCMIVGQEFFGKNVNWKMITDGKMELVISAKSCYVFPVRLAE